MSPLMMAALSSLVRAGLQFGAAWLVAHGVWTQGDSTIYVEAAAVAMVSYGWALWANWKSHHKIDVALSMPQGSSRAALDAAVQRA